MTAPLLLSFDPALPGPARTLAASLPASVRLVETVGEIALVDGHGDWPTRVAEWIGKGVGRVLVLDPDVAGAETLEPVLALAETRGAQIRLSESHGDNPAAGEVRGWVDGNFAVHTITGQGADTLAALVLQQLRIARTTGLQVVGIDHAVVSGNAVIAVLSARLGEDAIALRLTATRTTAGAGHHAWMAHAPDRSVSLTVYSGPAARPAQAMRMDAAGGHCPPTIFEHAHRSSLRAMLGGDDGGTERLREWLDDAGVALAIADRG